MRTALVAALIVCAMGVARAQSAPTQAEIDAQAKFEEGKAHFNLAEWTEAIASFKAAYRLAPEPLFLFNVAQSYRQAGDCRQALTFYKTYLREDPQAFNRDKVEKRITEMSECVRKAGGDPDAEPGWVDPEPKADDPVKPPVVVETRQPPPIEVHPPPPRPVHHRSHLRRTLGIATAGVGAIASGLGVYFSGKAHGYAGDLETACDPSCDADDPIVQTIDANGHDAQRNAAVSYALGATALVAGITLITWDLLDRESPQPIALVPSRSGAVLTATLHF